MVSNDGEDKGPKDPVTSSSVMFLDHRSRRKKVRSGAEETEQKNWKSAMGNLKVGGLPGKLGWEFNC